MKQQFSHILILTFICSVFAGSAFAKRPFLDEVNSVCGTNHDCDLCHIDPGGGGPLNPDGEAYVAGGKDPCIFCPNSPACTSGCTDNDGDGFFAESGCGTAVDCDDFNAAINPGAAEICDDMTDNDCDNQVDCADNECSNAPVCGGGAPEICDDGIDNDGDNKVDCADKKDCRTDPFCSGGGATEICDDGIDNDGDNKIDCADKKDCNKDPVCN